MAKTYTIYVRWIKRAKLTFLDKKSSLNQHYFIYNMLIKHLLFTMRLLVLLYHCMPCTIMSLKEDFVIVRSKKFSP